MVGSALKKLAQENGMKVDAGVAYGSFRGFAATFSEGANYKRISFSTLTTGDARDALKANQNGHDMLKEFSVQSIDMSPKCLDIVFHDTIGTMKKLRAFLDWFIPQLRQVGASGAEICTECGAEVTEGWKLMGNVACHIHSSCAQKIADRLVIDREKELMERPESYLTGAIGALLGALIGAAAWAAVLVAGYITSVVGLLIGFLSIKGYDLLRGKQGKGKIPIIICVTVLAVLLGNVGAYAYELARMIGAGELPGWSYSEIPTLLSILMEDSNFMAGATKDFLMSLLFAALGCIGTLSSAAKKVKGFQIVDLK